MKRPSKAGKVFLDLELCKALTFTVKKSVRRIEGLIYIRKIAILSKEGELSEGSSFEDDGSESGEAVCEGRDESMRRALLIKIATMIMTSWRKLPARGLGWKKVWPRRTLMKKTAANR